MKIEHQIILVMLALISVQLPAQNTILSGKASDYSNKEITFYKIQEPVLHQRADLITTKVASDGSFSVSLPISQTIEIYADLEKFCGTIVVEPGKKYTIVLPPFSLRTSNEAHSPYFKPALYWLGLSGANNSELNFNIRSFVTELNRETFKNTVLIYQNKSKNVVNEIIVRLEKKYSAYSNDYFLILKKYYFAELEYAVNQNKPEYVIQKYFASLPLQLSHPVYQKVFGEIFADFLRKQSLEIENRKIVGLTNSGNYLGLVSFFENKGYKKEFAELIVIKGLYDGYYTGSFSKNGVIKSIEIALKNTTSTKLQSIVNQVKLKLTLMAVGGKAPDFKLINLKKETVNLEKFSGKFVYLMFFDSRSSDCRAELDSIVSLSKKFGQVLNVVSVSVEENFENAVKLWNARNYTWELLDGSKDKQLISNYNASITPSFYLIDPKGNLRLSQAPSPSRGFDEAFVKLFRDYRFIQQRN